MSSWNLCAVLDRVVIFVAVDFETFETLGEKGRFCLRLELRLLGAASGKDLSPPGDGAWERVRIVDNGIGKVVQVL
jgi:hypothetical protein